MQPSFLQRYLQAFQRIEGWFSYDAALLFMAYNQLAHGPFATGNVLEIGVHHGLSTIAIASLKGEGKHLTAVDLFEHQQQQNISASGSGNRNVFLKNLKEFYPDSSFLRVLDQSSGKLKASDLGGGYTFCHIDGGHSPEETLADLELCSSIASPGGLIALDDYFNPEFPGVAEGVGEFFLLRKGNLKPLIAGYNRVLFENPGGQRQNLNEQFLSWFPELPHKKIRMWKEPVILLGEPLRNYLDLYASTPHNLVHLGASPRARIKPAQNFIHASKGQTIELETVVQNTSNEPFPFGEGIFGLSYHLLDGGGAMLINDNPRVPLRQPLKAGDSVTVRLPIVVPQEPAQYKIELDLVWENVMWFKDSGNPSAILDLSVS